MDELTWAGLAVPGMCKPWMAWVGGQVANWWLGPARLKSLPAHIRCTRTCSARLRSLSTSALIPVTDPAPCVLRPVSSVLCPVPDPGDLYLRPGRTCLRVVSILLIKVLNDAPKFALRAESDAHWQVTSERRVGQGEGVEDEAREEAGTGLAMATAEDPPETWNIKIDVPISRLRTHQGSHTHTATHSHTATQPLTHTHMCTRTHTHTDSFSHPHSCRCS